MCCLKYEQDAYEDLIKNSPKAESFVDTPEGRGTVVDIELLRQRVKVKMEEHPETISTFPISEIAVLRSGKAKKNDPPIPEDLAPISGNGKRPKAVAVPEEPALLDPIRFRYSTEAIVEEPVQEDAAPIPAEAEAEEKIQQPRRRNRKSRQERTEAAGEVSQEKPVEKVQEKPQKPKEKKPAQQEKTHKQPQAQPPREKPAEGESEEVPKKKNHHRRPNYYRHRKPKTSGEGGGE